MLYCRTILSTPVHIYQTIVYVAHNVFRPPSRMQFVCIVQLFRFWGCASPRACIGHKSFKCGGGGLPSFRLPTMDDGGNYSIWLRATNLLAGKQILLCNPRHSTCFSRVERLTYVNDTSEGERETEREEDGTRTAHNMAHKMATSVRFVRKDRLRKRLEENLSQAHA